MIGRCLLFGLLVLAFPAHAAGRAFEVAPPASWVNPAPVIPDRPSTGRAAGGIHYELVELQKNLALTPPEFFLRARMRVLNEEGLDEASQKTIEFEPSFEKLTIHDVHIERGGALIPALRADRVRVLRRELGLEYQVFSGIETAVITLEDVRVGDVIEYSYTLAGVNPALAGHPDAFVRLGGSLAVTCLERRVVWPAAVPANLRLVHTEAKPTVLRPGATVEYRWSLRDVPGAKYDSDLPQGYDLLPSAQVSGFADWQALARWGAALYPSSGPIAPRVQSVADTIARRTNDPEQRALLALRIVQDEVRYLADHLGEGAFRPSPSGEVLRRRFGDCKDKVALLLDLLRALGVRAEPALVSGECGRELLEYAPSPALFDHVIARVTIDGRRHWVDPTRRGQRGARLEDRSAADGSWVLVLAPGTLAPDWMEPPVATRAKTVIRKRISATSYTDTAHMTVVTDHHGRAAELVRQLLRLENPGAREEQYLGFYRNRYPEIRKQKNLEVADLEDSNLVRISESYAIPGFWVPDSTTGRYVSVLTPPELGEHFPPRANAGRKTPIGLPGPSLVRCETWLELPEGIRSPVHRSHRDFALHSHALAGKRGGHHPPSRPRDRTARVAGSSRLPGRVREEPGFGR